MAARLKNVRITSVDLVKAGANQEADICLYKSAGPVDTADEKVQRSEEGQPASANRFDEITESQPVPTNRFDEIEEK